MLQIALSFIWGIAVLLSWVGWGRLIEAWVRDRDTVGRIDTGLCAGWGMTLMLLIGGVLNATAECGPAIIVSLVVLGLILFAIDLKGRRLTLTKMSLVQFEWGYTPLIVLLSIVYAASICWKLNWNGADDFLAYNLFPTEMLQRGAAIDPFSWRRLSTLGGYAFLQATLGVVSWPKTAFQLDIGLGSVLNALLLVAPLRRRGATPLAASLPAMLCVLLPLGRINTMCSEIAVAGFLILVRTMLIESTVPLRQQRRLAVLLGAICTAIVTLRPNFLPVVAAAIVAYFAFDLWKGDRTLSSVIVSLTLATGSAVVCLLPWSVALYHAGGSYFYPLMHGNDHGGAAMLMSSMPLLALVRFILGFFLRPKMLIVILAGLLALIGFQKQVLALWVAAVAGAALTVWKLNLGDYGNLTRYALPALAAAAVAAVAGLPFERRTFTGRAVTAAIGGIVGLLIVYNAVSPVGIIRDTLHSLTHVSSPIYPDRLPGEYAAAQAAIPAGKTVLAFVGFPFLFDQRRNVVYSADEAGIASPGAGYPFSAGATAVARYLRSNHIDFLICDDFSQPGATSRNEWTAGLASDSLIIRRTAAYIVGAMNCFDELVNASPHVVRSGSLRVISVGE